MRLLLLGALILGTAASSASAALNDGYRSQTATTARLTAKLRYQERAEGGLHHYSDASVTMTRSDGSTFTYALRPLRSGYDTVPAGFEAPDHRAIHIRDLDQDGEPEVVVDLYWGGAHCCFYTTVFRYDAQAGRYVRASHLWGDVAPRLRHLDTDGQPEFVGGDERFAYAFTSFADSAFPIQIWKFDHGHFRQVTRDYPKAIRQDSAQLWRYYLKIRAGTRSVRGILAAYLAEKYLLGEAADGWARLKAAAARGDLSHQYDGPDSASTYLARLRVFLKRNGYGLRPVGSSASPNGSSGFSVGPDSWFSLTDR
jgi:hypothetical protein